MKTNVNKLRDLADQQWTDYWNAVGVDVALEKLKGEIRKVWTVGKNKSLDKALQTIDTINQSKRDCADRQMHEYESQIKEAI